MKQILFNLALFDTINFCKRKNINCSGSHLVKDGRGFKYSLIKDETGKKLVAVQFHKTSVPTYYVTPAGC